MCNLLYWLDKFYNLLEVINTDGLLTQIYVNVASPPQFIDNGFNFIDHELDVSMPVGQPARIVDEDEFEVAITRYGYAPEFVALCRIAAEEARLLAERWRPHQL
jgi:protein associated with RNAse G/E